MIEYRKVEGTEIIRDMSNMSLINRDVNEYNGYLNQRRALVKQKEELVKIKEEVSEIKNDISLIKELLLNLNKG